jgi:hypothetical protein
LQLEDDVVLRADCSYDLRCDGGVQALQYLWDINGDGIYGNAAQPAEPEGPEITLSYAEETTLRVWLKVVGGSQEDTASRDLRWTCERATPVIVCEQLVNPVTGKTKRCDPSGCEDDPTVHRICRGATIHFSAGESTLCDLSTEGLEYAWDLDGDGYYDDAAGPEVDASWQEAGLKEVGLRVARPSGGTGTDVGVGDSAILRILPVEVVACEPFARGDANGDGRLDISDAICILSFLFLDEVAGTCLRSGCLDVVDMNDDGKITYEASSMTTRTVCTYEPSTGVQCVEQPIDPPGGAGGGGEDSVVSDISDAIFLLSVLFGGQEPVEPYRSCGHSAREIDVLGCDSYENCAG